jgi:hypothetical protein
VIVCGTGDQDYNPVVKRLKLKTPVPRTITTINRRLGFEFQSFDYWVIILIFVVIVCSTADQDYNPVVKHWNSKPSLLFIVVIVWSPVPQTITTINRTLGFEFQLFDYWVIILISCTTDNHNNKQKTWFWVSVVWLLLFIFVIVCGTGDQDYNPVVKRLKLKTKSSVYCCDCLWYRRLGNNSDLLYHRQSQQ